MRWKTWQEKGGGSELLTGDMRLFVFFCLSSVWPFTHTLTHTDTQDTWKHRYSGTLCTQIYIHKLAKHRYNHINTHTYTHTHTEINRHQYVHAEIHTKTQHELRECARGCVELAQLQLWVGGLTMHCLRVKTLVCVCVCVHWCSCTCLKCVTQYCAHVRVCMCVCACLCVYGGLDPHQSHSGLT